MFWYEITINRISFSLEHCFFHYSHNLSGRPYVKIKKRKVTAEKGLRVSIECTAISFPSVTFFTWARIAPSRLNTADLQKDRNVVITNQYDTSWSRLYMYSARLNDAGTYVCTAGHHNANGSDNVTLIVGSKLLHSCYHNPPIKKW